MTGIFLRCHGKVSGVVGNHLLDLLAVREYVDNRGPWGMDAFMMCYPPLFHRNATAFLSEHVDCEEIEIVDEGMAVLPRRGEVDQRR